jgi:aromatic-L-amino-acid decarboxylase
MAPQRSFANAAAKSCAALIALTPSRSIRTSGSFSRLNAAAFWCAIRALLHSAFRVTADYLHEVHRDTAEVNFGDQGIQLTRSFRALKLWLSIKTFGMAAFREAVTRGFELAELAERELRTKNGWEILSPAQMGIVCFRFGAEDALQARIVDAMLREGYAFLTSTKVKGAICLRLCTINPRTTDAEMIETVKRLDDCARRCFSPIA